MSNYFLKLWEMAAGELCMPVNQVQQVAETLERFNLVERFENETQVLDGVKLSRSELINLACYDTLTGLPNSALLRDRIKQLISHYKRAPGGFAVMFIDLDGFKAVNDNLGHQAGDRVLKIVAKLLRRIVRECDTVARLHGDEFVIILDNVHVMSMNNCDRSCSYCATGNTKDCVTYKNLAVKILRGISAVKLGKNKVNLSASIGVSFFPEHKTVDGLLSSADLSMYEAKHNGKNSVNFSTNK